MLNIRHDGGRIVLNNFCMNYRQNFLKRTSEVEVSMSHYENRVTAFLDILGFKNWINNSVEENVFNQIKKTLEYIADERESNYHGFLSEYNTDGDKEISVFSDSIVISYGETERGGTFYLLMDLIYICIHLNQEGFFVRGGVTYGKLYHKDHVCFGPAMVKAYELEQRAIYPRIIVDKNVLKHGRNCPGYANTPEQEKEFLKSLILEDKQDGFI